MHRFAEKAMAKLKRIQKQGIPGERAYTLVEVMVVIVIIAVLGSIAMPNFMAAKNKASAASLIASMSSFAIKCGANMIANDPAEILEVPSTIKFSSTVKNACDGTENVNISNAQVFSKADIGGIRCGGVDTGNKADGKNDETCTLTINKESGIVTGAWS